MKIRAILSDQEAVELVTNRLTALGSEEIDWDLLEPSDDPDRLIPAFGWPASGGAGGGPAGTGGGIAVPVVADYPEDELLRDEGVDRDDADSYGRSVERGGTLIIIDAPSQYEGRVRQILEQANAQQMTTE
jgi:hypothetical protein